MASLALTDSKPARSAVRGVAQALGVAATYFVAAKFGMSLAFATKQVTAVWPPTGVAFVALLLLGYRVAPGVYLGALLANVTANETWLTAAGIALGNTLAGVVGVGLVTRFGGIQKNLRKPSDVLALATLGAALACSVSASAGVANLALSGIVPWQAYGSVWWVWWVGDALGVLLVAPFLLALLDTSTPPLPREKHGELLLLFGALALIGELTFSGRTFATDLPFRVEYAVFPCVIWAAVRFGQREATAASLVVSAFAIWGSIHDRGPFGSGPLDERLLLLDVFMAVVAATTLTLSSVVQERRNAETSLQAARDELELKVLERTAELATTNVELGRKNEEVEAFVYIVSHDLRAPLVNLQGFSKELTRSCEELAALLPNAALAEAPRRAVRRIIDEDIPGSLRYISASTVKFQRLIDALLALSRHGRQAYASERIDVQELVQSTLDSLHQSLVQSSTQVSVGHLPQAKGDTTAIGQVFSNLVVNALSYLDPLRAGQLEIGGERRGEFVEYWVKDNGLGIPASAKRRLFQVFQRFHPQRAQGEGMGLAIVKRVVERHGGVVWAESEEHVGSAFHLTLPADDAKEGT